MKASTVSELKKDLLTLSPKELTDLCLRLAKYKKENKELLTYLLYETGDESAYIQGVKDEMDELFSDLSTNTHYAKKTLRKILRIATKYIRYSGQKTTEIELLIHFCKMMKSSRISIRRSQQLLNLYERQLIKINKSILTLHEDLQYDYQREMGELAI